MASLMRFPLDAGATTTTFGMTVSTDTDWWISILTSWRRQWYRRRNLLPNGQILLFWLSVLFIYS